MKYNTTGYDLSIWKKKDVDRYRRLYMGIVTDADREDDLRRKNNQFQYTDQHGKKGIYYYEGNVVCYTGATPPQGITGYAERPVSPEKCPVIEEAKGAFNKQVAGSHYNKLAIQPMQYSLANGLNYAQANTIKYVTRYKDKNGIEDLKKAIHCIELLIEFEEGKKDDGND